MTTQTETPLEENRRADSTPEMFGLFFLFPDEDGSEFEKELTEALEGLNVSATADKLSKVGTRVQSEGLGGTLYYSFC